MPTEPSSLSGSVRSRASGDAAGGRLDRSLLLPLAMLVGPGGLRPLKVPRASVTVLMPPSSPWALLSILAAASELEKRAGRCGRGLHALKNSGDGGWRPPTGKWAWALLETLKWPLSSECRARVWTRRRLCKGSLAGAGLYSSTRGAGLFFPAMAGGVWGAALLLLLLLPPPVPPLRAKRSGGEMGSLRSRRRAGVHVAGGVCSRRRGRSSGVTGAGVPVELVLGGFVAAWFAKMDGGCDGGIDLRCLGDIRQKMISAAHALVSQEQQACGLLSSHAATVLPPTQC